MSESSSSSADTTSTGPANDSAGGSDSSSTGTLFIATHMRPSGRTATSTTAPSRVSSVIVFSGHSSAPVMPERLRIVGRGTPSITVCPTSIKSPAGVTATRFVRLPAGPGCDHAAVPGSGVETLQKAGRRSSYGPRVAMT